MKRLAVIPARSGSKGLKDKNIIDVCGKPLIAYTIEAARDSGLFDQIIVSTDSGEYGRISESYGARVMYHCLLTIFQTKHTLPAINVSHRGYIPVSNYQNHHRALPYPPKTYFPPGSAYKAPHYIHQFFDLILLCCSSQLHRCVMRGIFWKLCKSLRTGERILISLFP